VVQIRQAAPDLDDSAHAILLDAAVVWHVDASDSENILNGRAVLSRDARLGAAWLGYIVGTDAAPRAMATLAAAARNLALHRSGADMDSWYRTLEASGIQILPPSPRDCVIHLFAAPGVPRRT
jgi:hypothetical protein